MPSIHAHHFDSDIMAANLLATALAAKRMTPAWDGCRMSIPYVSPAGGTMGRLLPGRGLYLFDDLQNLGISRRIPGVFERSPVQRLVDRFGSGIALDPPRRGASRAHKIRYDERGLIDAERGAISTWDGVINSRGSAGKQSDTQLTQLSYTTVANTWSSVWQAGGTPGTGAYTNIPTGAVPTRATAGAWSLGLLNPTGSDKRYLLTLGYSAAQQINALMLIDLLVQAGNISATVTTAQTINSTAITRNYTPGTTAFGFIIFDISTALGATASNITVNKYCVDPETECLTRRGWKRYTDLVAGDEILAYDPAGHQTRWERPKEIFTLADYKGEMMLLGDKELSAFTTPDHRWPILSPFGRKKELRSRIVTSETLPKDGYIPRSAPYSDAPKQPIHSDAFVRTVAWYVTDGSSRRNGQELEIGQSASANAPFVDSIRSDIKSLGATTGQPFERGPRGRIKRPQGLRYREFLRKDGIVDFFLTGTDTDRIVAAAPGKEKVPTMDFLLSMTREQLQIFLDTMLCGDGTPSKRLFYQHHPARMAAYMATAVLAGYSPTLDVSGTCCALNGWRRGPGNARISLEAIKRTVLYYEGPIWCPVTESGHWVARRRGKVFITGNTNQAGTTLQTTAAIAMLASGIKQRLTPVANNVMVQLAAGDYGVQSVEEITLSASMTAGVFALNLYWPIAYLPGVAANTYIETPPSAFSYFSELANSGLVIGGLTAYVLTNTTSTGVLQAFLRSCAG